MSPHRLGRSRHVVTLLGLLAACGGSDDPAVEREQRARSGKGEIVIGAAWPWEAHGNLLYAKGLQLAVEELNAAGGVRGRRLRLLQADDRESVDSGRVVAQRLGRDPDVVAVIGHLQSYVTVPAAAIYDLAGLVLVSATTTTPELTSRGYRRVFRTIFSDTDVGRAMADYALRQGKKRMAVYYSRDEYGRGLANAFEERAIAGGGQVVDRRSYDPSDRNTALVAAQTATTWTDLNPEVVFIAGQDLPAAFLAAELRRHGNRALIVGSDALGTPTYLEKGGTAVDGTVIATPFHAESPAPEARRFTESFRKRFGTQPDVAAALGYDAVRLLAEGMRRASSAAPDQVAAALHQLRGWPGVTGTFSFDQSGNPVDLPIQKVVVRGGAFHFLDENAARVTSVDHQAP